MHGLSIIIVLFCLLLDLGVAIERATREAEAGVGHVVVAIRGQGHAAPSAGPSSKYKNRIESVAFCHEIREKQFPY